MMRRSRTDPRSVARDIPGLFDAIFPQLTPGIVAHYNRQADFPNCTPVDLEQVKGSSLQRAMLFELGIAAGESVLAHREIDWGECLAVATGRQRKFFDAMIPTVLTEVDRLIATRVADNLSTIISLLARERSSTVSISPVIPGFQWISSGAGDFAAGNSLIEVKCGTRNFNTADYRQIVMYWLLSFAASIERRSAEWKEGILVNPRIGIYVAIDFDELLSVIGSGRTKVEILQTFSALLSRRDII